MLWRSTLHTPNFSCDDFVLLVSWMKKSDLYKFTSYITRFITSNFDSAIKERHGLLTNDLCPLNNTESTRKVLIDLLAKNRYFREFYICERNGLVWPKSINWWLPKYLFKSQSDYKNFENLKKNNFNFNQYLWELRFAQKRKRIINIFYCNLNRLWYLNDFQAATM